MPSKHLRLFSISVPIDVLDAFDAKHGRGCRSSAIADLMLNDITTPKPKPKPKAKKKPPKADEEFLK